MDSPEAHEVSVTYAAFQDVSNEYQKAERRFVSCTALVSIIRLQVSPVPGVSDLIYD